MSGGKELHVYSSSQLARAVVEDELLAACGADLDVPRTQGGRPVRDSKSTGDTICAQCLVLIGPDRAARVIQKWAERQQAKEVQPA